MMKAFLSRSRWGVIDKLQLVAVASFAMFLAIDEGAIEGRYFPVVGPLTIDNPTPAPPPSYRTIWHGRAEKHRNCDYAGIEWFLGPRNGRRVQVRAEFTDPPKVRDAGLLEWSGLRVTLEPDETLENSHADVLHDCGWPWLTRTPFYDSP